MCVLHYRSTKPYLHVTKVSFSVPILLHSDTKQHVWESSLSHRLLPGDIKDPNSLYPNPQDHYKDNPSSQFHSPLPDHAQQSASNYPVTPHCPILKYSHVLYNAPYLFQMYHRAKQHNASHNISLP